MPFRKKIKETIKQAKDEVSSFLKVKDEQASDAAGTSLHVKIAMDRSDEPHPHDISNVDKSFGGLVQLTSQNHEVRAGVNINGGAFDSETATLTVPGPSELPAVEVSLATPVSGHVDPDDTNVPENQTLEIISPVVPEAPSAKWKGLKQFTRVLEPVSNLFGPVKETVDLFTECVDKYEMTGAAKTEYEDLRVRLEGLFDDLNGYIGEGCSLTMTSSMENLCRSIQAELDYIKKQQHRSIGERYLSAEDESDKALACYQRIEGHLQRLSDPRSDRMSSFVDRLPSSLPAWYDSAEGIELKRRGCTPDTRVDVLATILDWARSTGGGVYWLNGMAGTGKTTIAYSVCAELDARRQLGASFFCSRLREECRNVNVIIPSIAYQLARFSRPYQSALSAVLEKDPDAYGRLPHMQFDALIAKPMPEVRNTLPEELAVVIDALDECEQKESTARMLDVLLSKSASLPVKFIVSSRPESQIHDQMASERTRSRLVLHELDKGEVQADIEKYLREGLAQMHPSEAQIAALVERAGILFIYAATAVRYIGYDNFHRNPSARLRTMLERPQAGSSIDQRYTSTQTACEYWEELLSVPSADLLAVVGLLLASIVPNSMAEERTMSAITKLNSPDRARQKVSTIINMVAIRQHYRQY
ncbi:NACHT domain protein, partial [Rhizoctonia solani AG-3 Rhs1AP]